MRSKLLGSTEQRPPLLLIFRTLSLLSQFKDLAARYSPVLKRAGRSVSSLYYQHSSDLALRVFTPFLRGRLSVHRLLGGKSKPFEVGGHSGSFSVASQISVERASVTIQIHFECDLAHAPIAPNAPAKAFAFTPVADRA
jgi:hypothetical protein